MYEPLIFIHSWLRWIVFIAILFLSFRTVVGWWRRDTWTGRDNYLLWAFNQVFGYQVAFGITLWIGSSPMTKAFFKDPSLFDSNEQISFWVGRHGLTMIAALGVFHVGKLRAKKVVSDRRFGVFAITFPVTLALIVSAIPWPWLAYGRALFRWIS